MLEQELNPLASKFISSLVKSLQLLCNGHVEYNESIELIGHINVRVDGVHKYDYIVDEQVSKEGNNSSTFLSNSYHSQHPSKSLPPPPAPVAESQPVTRSSTRQENASHHATHTHTVKVSHKAPTDGNSRKQDNIMVKMEGSEDDCMVLPASPEDYEPIEVPHEESRSLPGTSTAQNETYEVEYDGQQNRVSNQESKKRKLEDTSNHDGDASDSKEMRGKTGGKRSASELIGKFAAYECSYCSVILTEYEDLTLHSKSCPSPSCSMICLTCGEKLPNKPEMRQHLKLVHSHKTFGCKYCEMMFLSSSGLLSHTKAKHKPDAKTLCQLCGQAFHNKANLEGHMNMHLGIRPFKCKRCGKSYGHSKSLITHEKMCKSIVSSPKMVAKNARAHLKNSKKQSNQNASKKAEEKKDNLPPLPPPAPAAAAAAEPAQQPIVYEPYQPFEGREQEKRDNEISERTMTLIQNANQNFTFTDSSYPQTFAEPVSQPNLVMTAVNSTNPPPVPMANTVYAHPNTSFVLPQVAYGMYQQGILPDQR